MANVIINVISIINKYQYQRNNAIMSSMANIKIMSALIISVMA
jgi:hypothetical protein